VGSELTAADIQVGKTYRAKRPQRMGLLEELNDRTVLHVGRVTVQYDSPSVRFGQHYPKVSMEKFLAWASHEVVEEPTND
jgi:hypothetical protein